MGRARTLLVVGENIRVQIRHRYRSINKLGSDRLVNAFGASRIYRAPVLILDYGTALTCDYVSAKGIFEGGLIIPGPSVALEALVEKAALLPQIRFPQRTSEIIGRDTKAGMRAGILQGYGAMTDGLVARFRKRYGRRFKVIATGGLAAAIAHHCSSLDKVDPLLTLRSLVEVFKTTPLTFKRSSL